MSSSGFNANNGNFPKFSNNSNRKPFENIKYFQNERPSFGNNDNRNYDSFSMSNNNNKLNKIELGKFDDIRTFNDSQQTATDCFPSNYKNEGTVESNVQIKPPFGINDKGFGNLYDNKGGYYGGSGNSGNIEPVYSNTFKMNSMNGPHFGNDEGFSTKSVNARNFDRLSSNYAPQGGQRANIALSGKVEQYGNDQQFDIPGGNDVQQFENVDNIGPSGGIGILANHERPYSNYGNEGLRNNFIIEDCLPRSVSNHNLQFVGSNLIDEHLGTGEVMPRNYESFPNDNDIIDGRRNDNFRNFDEVELRGDHGDMPRISDTISSDYRFEEGFRSTSFARGDEQYGGGVSDLPILSNVDDRDSERFMRKLREEVEEEEERVRRNKYQHEKDYRSDRNSYHYHRIENRRSHSVSRQDSIRRRRALERDDFRSREKSPLTLERRSFNYRNERGRHSSPEIRGELTSRRESGRYGSRQHYGYSRDDRNYERDLKFENTGSRYAKRNEELGRSLDRNRFNKRPIDQVGLSSQRSRYSRERITEVARNPRFHKKRDVSSHSREDLRMTPTDLDKDSVSSIKKLKKEPQAPLDGHIKHEPEQYWREWWTDYAYIEKVIDKIDENDEAVKPLLSFHCELTDLTLNDKVDGIFTRGTAKIQHNLNINEMNYQNRDAFKLLKYKKLLEDSNYQKYLLPKELVLLRKTLRSLNNKCVLALLYQSIIRRWDHSSNLVKLVEKGQAIKAKQARYLMKDKLFHFLVLDSIQELKKLTAEDWPGFDEFYNSLQ